MRERDERDRGEGERGRGREREREGDGEGGEGEGERERRGGRGLEGDVADTQVKVIQSDIRKRAREETTPSDLPDL